MMPICIAIFRTHASHLTHDAKPQYRVQITISQKSDVKQAKIREVMQLEKISLLLKEFQIRE